MAMSSSDSKQTTKSKRGRIQSAPAGTPLSSRRIAGQVADLGFEGSRHVLSNRVPSARGERVVGLRLSEVNGDLMKCVLPLTKTLKRLDLSGIRLDSLPSEFVEELTNLERLDISSNNIRDFGPLCQQMQGGDSSQPLVELLAYGNQLRRLPVNFGLQFPVLRRLNLAQNRLQSCTGIEELKCLQVLILDNNRLESFDHLFYENLRRLEVLHCAENSFTCLDSAIRNLRHLRNLDFSGNKLDSIPAELFLLARLEVINLGRNRISRIPTIHLRALKHRPLSVDLSDNQLVKFPQQMLSFVRKLDLSRNKIKTIPITITKFCSEKDEISLEITGNPITEPPLEVCESGLGEIIRYFQTSEESPAVLSQGLKVLVVGSSGHGKTSFIQSLIDEEPRLTGTERTAIIDIFDHYIEIETVEPRTESDDDEVENSVTVKKIFHLSIWDFSGNDRCLVPLHHFIQMPSLIILVFSLAHYNDKNFENLIGNWINWILSKAQRVVLVPVGTHADLIDSETSKNICGDVSTRIDEFFKERNRFIDDEIERIENRRNIAPSLSEHLKHCLNLKRLQVVLHPTVLAVSSQQMEGINEVITTIKQMVTDTNIFGPVLQSIPSRWEQVESFITGKSRSLGVPFMTWKEFEKEVVEQFGMKRILRKLLQYLHNVGKVVWFSENDRCLGELIFLRPEWLIEALRALYRQDASEVSQLSSEDYGLKANGLTTVKFDRLRRDFMAKGVLDKDFFRCLVWSLLPSTNFNKSFTQLSSILMERLDLGYTIPSKGLAETVQVTSGSETRSSAKSSQFSAEQNTHSATENSRLLAKSSLDENTGTSTPTNYALCSLRAVPRPQSFDELYESRLKQMPGVVAVYRFSIYLPPGIFDRITSRTQSAEVNFGIVMHWEKEVYAVHRVKAVHLLMRQRRIEPRYENSSFEVIQLETRVERSEHESKQLSASLEELWTALLPLLNCIDSMLSTQYSGTYVERRMTCPLCQDDCFVGEWQTPKRLQSLQSSVDCVSCRRDVDCAFIVQPRQKRVVDKFLQEIVDQRQKQQQKAVTPAENTDEFQSYLRR